MKNKNLSDWMVALSVIACSVVLFLALAFALSGAAIGRPAREVRVNFHDITGINPGAQVKFSGAIAGRVAEIRILSDEERRASGDPRNAVQLVLGLTSRVPSIPSTITASISADTLLSDKFVLLVGGSPDDPPLANDAVVQGITPTSFDELARNLDVTLNSVNSLIGGAKGGSGDVMTQVRGLLTDTHSLVNNAQAILTEAKPVIQDAQVLTADAKVVAADARQLISETRVPITQTINRLGTASTAFEQLAVRGNNLLGNNERKLTSTITNFGVISENLKVTSAYTRILSRFITERPSRLIWGGSPPQLPSEEEILRATKALPPAN